MVTNHIRSPYGVYFTKTRTILRSPYGARPAAERIVRFLVKFLDIVRCPVKFRYYLKFHGARMTFGRVNEGKITSAGHRTVPGRRPAGVCTHRTGTGPFLFKIYIVRFQQCLSGHRTVPRPGIVRCLTSAGNFQISLNKSADARPGTGRCPSGHRPMFYESNRHR